MPVSVLSIGLAFSLLGAPAAPLAGSLAAKVPQPQGLKPVSYLQVELKDKLWTALQKINATKSIWHQFNELESTGRLQNFRTAAARKRTGYQGLIFNDSDVHKVIEAGAYIYGKTKDPKLDAKLDEIIGLLAAAQEPDGYLYTSIQVQFPEQKWKNLRDLHEIYTAGHLFEAAAAHYQATGKKNLLNVATKLADLLCKRHLDQGIPGYCGHPEAELALFKLADATGEKRYYDLAKKFLVDRGSKFFAAEHNTPLTEFNGEYWLDHEPIQEHRQIVGHAVRAAYLYSGATDLAAREGDPKIIEMLDRVWRNTAERKMFVTGGLGPSASNEGFTHDYDLPEATAYQETCASIANVLWSHRMGLLHGDGKYFDVAETALFNGVLSGGSLSGDRYNYVNPLAGSGSHHRRPWFECACCPPNHSRTIAMVGGYLYAHSHDTVAVTEYASSTASAEMGSQQVGWEVQTGYPWKGDVKFSWTKAPSGSATVKFRIPSWSGVDKLSVSVGGSKQEVPVKDGFISVNRTWKAGDSVQFEIPFRVRRVEAHPNADMLAGKTAMGWGPMIYCLEGVDNKFDFDRVGFPASSPVKAEWETGTFPGTPLSGITVLKGKLLAVGETNWSGKLYADAAPAQEVPFKAIPYAFWDNRAAGALKVWLPTTPPASSARGLEKSAKIALSFVSGNCVPAGASDGIVPKTSGITAGRQCHWWPHKGPETGIAEEWIEYTWDKPQTLSSSRVFWFDDTGAGECRKPAAWRLESWNGSAWVPVVLERGSKFATDLDKWVEVEFTPIKTQKLRLTVQLPARFSTGIHEWQVQ